MIRKKFTKSKTWESLAAADQEMIKNGCLDSLQKEPEKLGMLYFHIKLPVCLELFFVNY